MVLLSRRSGQEHITMAEYVVVRSVLEGCFLSRTSSHVSKRARNVLDRTTFILKPRKAYPCCSIILTDMLLAELNLFLTYSTSEGTTTSAPDGACPRP